MNDHWYSPLTLFRSLLGTPTKPDVRTANPSEFGRKTRTKIQKLRRRKQFKQRK